MGVRTEEATFTFSGVDWEVPFQGQFFYGQEPSGQCGQLSVGQGRKTRWRDH